MQPVAGGLADPTTGEVIIERGSGYYQINVVLPEAEAKRLFIGFQEAELEGPWYLGYLYNYCRRHYGENTVLDWIIQQAGKTKDTIKNYAYVERYWQRDDRRSGPEGVAFWHHYLLTELYRENRAEAMQLLEADVKEDWTREELLTKIQQTKVRLYAEAHAGDLPPEPSTGTGERVTQALEAEGIDHPLKRTFVQVPAAHCETCQCYQTEESNDGETG